jgi:hypothetical protein
MARRSAFVKVCHLHGSIGLEILSSENDVDRYLYWNPLRGLMLDVVMMKKDNHKTVAVLTRHAKGLRENPIVFLLFSETRQLEKKTTSYPSGRTHLINGFIQFSFISVVKRTVLNS